MKIFTVTDGKVERGLCLNDHTLSNGVSIKVVSVGETGRGRSLSFLPVQAKSSLEWIFDCTVGKTLKGSPKIIESDPSEGEECLIVFRTSIGFRGTNDHTGDRLGTDEDGKATGFQPFPGQVLAAGRIAQGAAGNMGSGQQIIAIMPKNQIFRVVRGGRLYGAPPSFYGFFDGLKVQILTWEDRQALGEW